MLERCEAYRDSGVEWIGEVPEHWGVSKFAFAGTTSLGKMLTPNPETEDDQLLPYLCAANVKESGIVLEQLKEMYFSPKDGDKYMLMCSDLVVVEGGNVGLSHVWTGGEMRIQNALHRFRANEQYVAEYLKYSLDVAKNAGYIDLVCNKATIAHFTSEKLMETPVCCIPLCEQRAIADYLDEKTAEIDSIVSETERSIELLREYRKSVISEAVTKGLDPDAPMKDSGIEWMGEIPETWRMKRTRYFVSSFRKGFGITKDEISDEGDIFCVRYGEIYSKYNEKIVEIQSKTLKETIAAPQRIVKGNLLFACTGELVDEIGKNVLFDSDYPCLAGGDIIVADHEQNPGFLNYSLGSYVAQCQKSFGKAKLKVVHIAANELGNIRMPIPPLSEQQFIADYLDTKTSEIDALIADKERQVELLKEYRKSLISEAVTGKFKVPGVS